MTNTLIMLCGVPGSGKSSYIASRIPYLEAQGFSTAVISRDTIRKSMVGEDVNNENYFLHEDDVFDEFIRQINESMEIGINVVYVDATHISVGSRRKLLSNLKPDSRTALNIEYMITPPEICKERNSKRAGFALVPDSAMDSMIKNFRVPSLKEIPDNNYGFRYVTIGDAIWDDMDNF